MMPRQQSQRQQAPRQPGDFEEKVLQIKRISKKTKGGNKISFSALVIVGDKKGRVGCGYAKGPDVSTAVQKAISLGKKDLFFVKLKGQTIAHEVTAKYCASIVMLKPAPKGAGIIAGGPIRVVAELAGIKDVSAKMIGANNKISNVRCTIKALSQLRG